MSNNQAMTGTFIGRSLGKYTVESKLGQGGMGMVYLGRQRSLNRSVAIKVLPALMAMDTEFVQRFRQEAQVIAGLVHENIVHVYDIDETEAVSGESIYFIVMEFVDGFNLRQRPDRDQPMSWQRVRAIGLPVARALDYAHRRGIVHRDIKPANIMETRDGKIKLMDFGIAKSAGGVKTVTGSVLGTPEYMAPEQAQSGKVTPQSDIYSLGVLLYELVTGRLPFQADEPIAIALKHISEQPEPPSRHTPTVPPWLERVILRSMEKNPADRFADAAALAHALERAGADSNSSSVQTERPGNSGLPSDLAPTLRTPTSHADPVRIDPVRIDPVRIDPVRIDPTAPTLQTPASGMASSRPDPPPPPEPLTASRRPVAWWPVAAALGALALVAVAAIGYYVLGAGDDGDEGIGVAIGAISAAPGQDLASAETSLRAGDLKTARRHLDVHLSRHPDDPDAIELGRRLEHAEHSLAQALAAGDLLGEIDGAPSELADGAAGSISAGDAEETPAGTGSREGGTEGSAGDAGGRDPAAGDPAAADRRTESAARPVDESPIQAPRVQTAPAPGPPLRDLVQRARRHRADKEYHSMRRVLRQIEARNRVGRLDDELETWGRKVDEWVRKSEKSLRNDVEDLLDDFVDAVEEEDMEDLSEVWGDSIDTQTTAFFRRYWQTYRKSRAEVELRGVEPWDREAAFVAVVRIYGKKERRDNVGLIRTVTWRGKISDRGDTRMIAPFPGP